MNVLESKVQNWHQVPDMEITDDWRTYDLQNVLIGNGFKPLRTDAVLAGDAEKYYADLEFNRPMHFHTPPEVRMGYLRNPAVSISRSGDHLKMVFGSVFHTASGWRITNSTASHLEPEKLIVPSPVSYFKQR